MNIEAIWLVIWPTKLSNLGFDRIWNMTENYRLLANEKLNAAADMTCDAAIKVMSWYARG